MGISDRIEDSIERWRDKWADNLSDWFINILEKGVVKFIDNIEPDAQDMVKNILLQVRDFEDTPDTFKEMIDRILAEGHPLPLLIVIPLAIIILLPMLFSLSQPLSKRFMYLQDRLIHSARFDPIQAITAWRRDPEKYAELFDDLKALGWDDDRIEAWKFITQFYPSPQDLVNWQAKEVFEPNMINKYGLLEEFGELDLSAFSKAGVTEEQAKNYWIAHWEHASYQQMVEMYRRGLIEIEDFRAWFRLVEIPIFWRDNLIEISWNVPTRVDVRRFWDMRTIDEDRLRQIYTAQGYHDKDLDDYVLWTKVYVAFPDLMARFSNGWLSKEEVEAELTGLGMPPDRVEEMMQTKVKAVESTKTTTERELTKSEIYKAVKNDRVTRGEAKELLTSMKYSDDNADLLLDLNVPEDEVASTVTRRELTKTDIKAALSAGEYTVDQAREKLLDLRYTSADVELLLRIYQATINPPQDTATRELTKTDIVAGVKKGVLTPEDAYIRLQEIGYSPADSQFILEVKAEQSPFSPANYQELLNMVDLYNKASGGQVRPITDEIKKAGADLVAISRNVEVLQAQVKSEQRRLVSEEAMPDEAEAKLKALKVALFRAEAEKDRLQADYNAKLVAWRHGS